MERPAGSAAEREKLPPEQYTAKYWTDKIAEFDAANPEYKKWFDSLGTPGDSVDDAPVR